MIAAFREYKVKFADIGLASEKWRASAEVGGVPRPGKPVGEKFRRNAAVWHSAAVENGRKWQFIMALGRFD